MQNLSHEELEALIKRCRAGDKDAFDTLYRAFYRMVYFTTFKLLKNTPDVEDVVQDIFVTVFEKLPDLENDRKFIAWLNRIIFNTCQNYLKDRQRKSHDPIDDTLPSLEELDPAACPGVAYMEDEQKRLILKAIDQLSADHREVILMKYYAELKIREIAEILGISDGTVKSRLKYSRDYLRKYLQSYRKSGLLVTLPIGAVLDAEAGLMAKVPPELPLQGQGISGPPVENPVPKSKMWPYTVLICVSALGLGISLLAAFITKSPEPTVLPQPTATLTAQVSPPADTAPPYVSDSEFSPEQTVIYLGDDGSDIDFGSIYTESQEGAAPSPIALDPEGGKVTFPHVPTSYTLYFSDTAGNVGHALVEPEI